MARILATNSEVRDFALDAELNWHLEMGDGEVHTGISPSMIKPCIIYEHERGATTGVLYVRLDAAFSFLRVEFTVED